MAANTRTGRASSAGQSRFTRSTPTRAGRPSGAGKGRFARSTATPRRSTPTQGLRRRKAPQKSGLQKAMSAVLPGGAAKKVAPSSKKGKAGGFALVAAAAGMAFKNRGKLGELRRKGTDDTPPPAPPASVGNASTPPAGPVA